MILVDQLSGNAVRYLNNLLEIRDMKLYSIRSYRFVRNSDFVVVKNEECIASSLTSAKLNSLVFFFFFFYAKSKRSVVILFLLLI